MKRPDIESIEARAKAAEATLIVRMGNQLGRGSQNFIATAQNDVIELIDYVRYLENTILEAHAKVKELVAWTGRESST